ncbi:MAG: hypothetical protein K2Q20_08540 [Phycisphaerales bacterium]|nr:hypothetical protein [Phycisphaerales bacterium]
MPRATAAIPFLLAALATAAAPAQTRRPAPTLTPVEQNVGDLGPLTTSLRTPPADLRTPMEFDRVYRVPGSSRGINIPQALSPAGGQDGSRLARVSGGITAVFPSSDYMQTKKSGIVPVVPAGTVFYIGPIPQAAPPQTRRISPFAVDTLAVLASDTRSAPAPILWEAELKPAPAPLPTPVGRRHLHVMTDEQYRRDRVRRVLGLARR